MIDNGKKDEKIIAIPFDDPTYNNYRDISELPTHLFEEMRHFFSVSIRSFSSVIQRFGGELYHHRKKYGGTRRL